MFLNSQCSRFISKLLSGRGENGNGKEPRFSAAGWVTGSYLKQILVNSQQQATKAFNSNSTYYQNVRGFRSGKSGKPESSGSKINRKFILTALEDTGTRMADRSDLFLRPFAFTAFVC